MAILELSVGSRTEELLQFVTAELTDEQIDLIEIERSHDRSDKLATEPLTVAATLTLSTTLVIAIGRIIERWIEKQNQLEHMKIVAAGFQASDEAGKGLAKLSEKHASVSIQYRLPTSMPPRKG
jgi:hypothetical protein